MSTTASGLHAASAMLSGASLADRKLAEALAAEVAALRAELAALGVRNELFFQHAIPLSVTFDAPLQLVEVILARLFGPGCGTGMAAPLSRRLIALEAAFQRVNPRALEELELRAAPIGEQWEARGPGLMATLARLTDRELMVEQADVILVQPIVGGGGAAHPLYNSVSLEAVLANPVAELPEVVRLGWLLAQLNLDLPRFQEGLPVEAMPQLGALAMIPPALAAAEAVELARCDAATVSRALAAWQAPAVEPDKLFEWWETYQAEQPPWAVALGALHCMLSSEPPNAETIADQE